MGFNTVAFLLNDYMHELRRSPHGAMHLLTHPRMSAEDNYIIRHADAVANEHAEPALHPQALEVLPTFHADQHKIFMAGGNCIVELEALRFGKTKEGKKTITLELPEWFNEKSGHCYVRMKSYK